MVYTPEAIETKARAAIDALLSEKGGNMTLQSMQDKIAHYQTFPTTTNPFKMSSEPKVGDLVMDAARSANVAIAADAAQTVGNATDKLIKRTSQIMSDVLNENAKNNPNLKGDALSQVVAQQVKERMSADKDVMAGLKFANGLVANLKSKPAIVGQVPELKTLPVMTIDTLSQPLKAEIDSLTAMNADQLARAALEAEVQKQRDLKAAKEKENAQPAADQKETGFLATVMSWVNWAIEGIKSFFAPEKEKTAIQAETPAATPPVQQHQRKKTPPVQEKQLDPMKIAPTAIATTRTRSAEPIMI